MTEEERIINDGGYDMSLIGDDDEYPEGMDGDEIFN